MVRIPAWSVPSWPSEDARISAWQARIIALNAGVSLLLLASDGIPI